MSNLVAKPANGTVAKPNWSSWIDDWFSRDLNTFLNPTFNSGMTLPAVNIQDTADAYLLEMAIPGMQKSDFKIDLDNHELTISCEKERAQENEDTFTRKEFGYASFTRRFVLPDTIEESKISAEYQDGILKLRLPKLEEAKKKPARTIKIK